MKIEQKLNKLSKSELGELMDDLQRKIDSGRHTGAQVQILKLAIKIYINKFEPSLL